MTQIEQQNVPKLRFSKFGDSEWSFATLADHLSAHQERVPANTDIPIYSSSRTGLKSQKDYFAGDELRNEGEYGVVPHGFFTYRHMSDDLTFKFNLNNLGHPIAVSKEYPVFETVELDPRFLLDWLNNSPHFSRFAAQQKLGGTRTRLYFKNLKTLKIHLPTLPEQLKIAGFLGAVDERVAQVTRKKALLEDYKKGCMQQLFSQSIRFKDDQGNDFPDWEEKRVSDVFEITRGQVLAVPKMTQEPQGDSTFPVYSSQTKNKGLTGYYKEFLYKNAITWTTDGANAGNVQYRSEKFYCTNVCGVLLSDEGYANSCIAEMLNRVTEKYVSYVGNPKLMNNVMGGIKINFPHPDEQQKIADFLSAIDTKIDLLAQELGHAQTFKKGLLQQMFV